MTTALPVTNLLPTFHSINISVITLKKFNIFYRKFLMKILRVLHKPTAYFRAESSSGDSQSPLELLANPKFLRRFLKKRRKNIKIDKVLIQLFQKLVGCGATPHGLDLKGSGATPQGFDLT